MTMEELFSSFNSSVSEGQPEMQRSFVNKTDNSTANSAPDIINNQVVQALFCVLYTTIFVLGVFGNVLVCYVVGRNKAMQTVTNFFITNLALSDILLCALAVPFTPLYSFLGQWVFGSALCHLVAYAQGTSVYISTLTLTSIAVDRFFVIIYPFHPRMKLVTCLIIIAFIWIFSLLVTLPYGIYMVHQYEDGTYYCTESWPTENFRQIFGALTATMQFVLPFFIIAFCYVKVSIKLNDRARAKPGCKNSRKEEADRERKRRTNRMLIAMVTIFGVSWMPLNLINIVNDIYIPTGSWKYYYLCFFLAHALAMSSTCYNPFLYAWLNENFRKEFKQVLPCFDRGFGGRTSGPGASGRSGVGGWKSERTCNGNETLETLLPSSAVHRCGSVRQQQQHQQLQQQQPPSTIVEEEKATASATYSARGDEVRLHLEGHAGAKDVDLLAGVLGESM